MNLVTRGMKRKCLASWKTVVILGIFVAGFWYLELDSYVLGSQPKDVKKTRTVKLKPLTSPQSEEKQNHVDHLKHELDKLDRISQDRRSKSFVKLGHMMHHTNVFKEKDSAKRLPVLFDYQNAVEKQLMEETQQKVESNKIVMNKDIADEGMEKSNHQTSELKRTKFQIQKAPSTSSKLNYPISKGDLVVSLDISQRPPPHPYDQVKKGQCGGHLKEIPSDKQEFLLVQDRPVYLFSAYLDTRKAIGGPQIRIIAAGLQQAYNKIPSMYCTIWWRDKYHNIYGVNSGKARYQVIYRSTVWPKMYTSHFILCDIPSTDVKPIGVSIVPQPCSSHLQALPIQTLIVPEKDIPYQFSLCISPLYGRVPYLQLIEFIEIHRLLGVEKFTFYKHSISPRIEKLFQYYKKQDLVDVVDWKFPRHVEQSYFMQRVALNDCIYRNMAKSKFVGIYDIDEVVVPNKGETWSKLFSSLEKDYPTGGAFLLQHAYFRRNNSIKSEPNLMTQNSVWRTSNVYPEGKIRCKSIYLAQRSLAVDIHFPYSLIPGFEEVIIKPETAILHHYRETPMSNFNKQKDLKFKEDNSLLRYGKNLKRRTSKVIKIIE